MWPQLPSHIKSHYYKHVIQQSQDNSESQEPEGMEDQKGVGLTATCSGLAHQATVVYYTVSQ